MLKRRLRRTEGFSLLEVTISMGIMGFGLLGVAAMQLQALSAGATGRDYRQAVAVARDQMERVQTMTWDDMAPTAGFEAPTWISYSGYATGQLPVRLDTPSGLDGVTQQVYDVEWRVQDANVAETLRSVDLRVTWTDPTGRNRVYALSTMRSKS